MAPFPLLDESFKQRGIPMRSVSISVVLILTLLASLCPPSLIAAAPTRTKPHVEQGLLPTAEIPVTQTIRKESAEESPNVTLAPEQRIALVIGNSAYSSGPLKNPVNDATDMAASLRKLGFKVDLKKNADLETMELAIEDFGNRLKKGGVGLFYYAGHGVQVNGVNYLVPVGARINKESDVRYRAVDAGRILDEMANANNGMNIVLLDACRDNPFGKTFRSASRGLAIVSNAPTGTFISYSTGPGQVARDGEGRNSPYTKALLQYMQEPAVPIGNVFMKVRQQLRNETGQVPWELSSLEGDFFFIPQGGGRATVADAPPLAETPHPDAEALLREKEALEREKQEVLRAKEELERQKALAAEREQLAAERRKLEAEKEQMALAKRSAQPAADNRRIVGLYNVAGTNPNGTTYRGVLTLTRTDGAYMLVWKIGSSTFTGTGNFQGESLVINWGQSHPVIYSVAEDGRLIGTWNGGNATEILTPVK
jgi:uncharacterized caspase-like protein